MLASLLQGMPFDSPSVDFHALAPELVLTGAIVAVLLADLFTPEGSRGIVPSIAGIGLLAALVPVLTLALDGADRVMFGGAYTVDNFSLVLKAMFLLSGYVVVLLSTNYIAEGDYAEGEYYFLLLSSLLGMVVMASSRDLVSIFVALELLSIPAYMLAGWRKRDLHGNEAGVKYYLMGVFASAVMLYGMSLLYGFSGSTLLADIGSSLADGDGFGGTTPVHHARHRLRRRRLRLQGVRGAVPHVGPRHLRGRAHPDHRVPRRPVRRRPASSPCSS